MLKFQIKFQDKFKNQENFNLQVLSNKIYINNLIIFKSFSHYSSKINQAWKIFILKLRIRLFQIQKSYKLTF
ncbi:unnamed protein product [Paramecium sonneborni]|uniref:Uncharacterized protein n=1 Tax=Paramecium sonneborni TaxID=65129 RepID=A0A8S1KHF8_9CILI|nr:unnamed protein product [Paramecium sonneborni]